jgi:hypothetical protein
MSDAHTDGESEEGGDTIDTLRRENIPETAHIAACGVVISDDGETLGEIESGGTRSSRSNPKGRDDTNTSIAEGSDE